ncbi:MAG: HDIG domain-containing protein, partial [Pseudomonadota bacterium]|nr:HDIG domain-containing protein [Pseudomonadota bacterium]
SDGVQVKCHEDQPKVTLNGGLGVAREALRLTLNSILVKKSKADKLNQTYAGYLKRLEHEASRLGGKACHQLQLRGIAPEIQKLIGYLNWRTSYKQNQWYHSIEVATLAGLLGHELGVDPQLARRCGLLHDIGKAIDYRIEGSHAVISGDYADRYGESRVICDAVMSHHNDLILETPLAYVLKSADTLSGARPGARVNLEDDYQNRLNTIEDVIRTFDGITKVEPMHGAREVRVEVDQKRVKESDLESLTKDIAQKLTDEVAFPGQIKVMVTRKFESTRVA